MEINGKLTKLKKKKNRFQEVGSLLWLQQAQKKQGPVKMMLMRSEIEIDSVEFGLEVILVIIQHDKYSLHFCLFSENLQEDELKGEFVSGENYKLRSAQTTAQVLLDAFSQIRVRTKKEWNRKIWETCSLARKGAQERAVAKEINKKKKRRLEGFTEIHEVTAIKDSG